MWVARLIHCRWGRLAGRLSSEQTAKSGFVLEAHFLFHFLLGSRFCAGCWISTQTLFAADLT